MRGQGENPIEAPPLPIRKSSLPVPALGRNADKSVVVLDGAGNRLPNPRKRIRREFRTLIGVEPVNGPRQAKNSFLDKVYPFQVEAFPLQPEMLDRLGTKPQMAQYQSITHLEVLLFPDSNSVL